MNTLRGTPALIRLALRRDRIVLPIWIVAFAALAMTSAAATIGLYSSAAAIAQAAAGFNDNVALVALYGRIYDTGSVGEVAMLKPGGTVAVLVALLSAFAVVRHTRGEEETGRLELLGAGMIGRHAAAVASILLVVAADLLLGMLTAVGLLAVGLPAAGSFAFGLEWAGIGAVFALVGAVAAQLTTRARSAMGLVAAALGTAYLLRAIGDARSPGWLSWLSPFGWAQQVRAFAGDRWWVLLPMLACVAALATVGFLLSQHRDLGAALLPVRDGRPAAGPRLRGPLGLAWRTQRGSFAGWLAGFVVAGLVFGDVAARAGDFFTAGSAQHALQSLGGQTGLNNAMLAAELGLMGVLAAAYGVQSATRLHTDESAHGETLFALPLNRLRWAALQLLIAFIGSAVLLAVTGVAAGIVNATATSDRSMTGRVLAAALAHIPSTWLVIGVAVAVFGMVPRWNGAGWVAFGAFVVLGEFGPVLRLNHWLIDLSPFWHAPKMPGTSFDTWPALWLLVLSAALVGAGLAAFGRRDLVTPGS